MALLRCFSCLAKENDEIILELDFSNNALTDIFPNIWQHERTLEELYLSSAHIKSLPPELFYCQNLRVLVVNNNNLESIPNAISALRQLQTLNLSRNSISTVPDNMKSCKNLTHLDLSCNNLRRLPNALSSLITLKELFLNETYLEFLPANFGRLINLEVLELRLNNLITLPRSMARLTNLLRLDIGYNEFTDLPEVVGELKQLRELWIDFNQINRVSASVGKLRDLLHFDGAGNNISILPMDMCNWRNIEMLSLCGNNLSRFPFSLGSLKSLVTLKCESNNVRQLPDSISNLEHIEELELSHNNLTCLPTTIGMLRKLRYLFVDDNDLISLPDEICSCSELRILSISRNKISELSKSTGRLTNLRVLNIVNNRISSLPLSVLNLTNLTSLWISDNQSQPLVPLQYLDINTKLELTCFMLPQVSKCMSTFNYETRSPSFSNEPHTFKRSIENIEYDNSYRHESQANNSYPLRRICFAEKAIIMSAPPKEVLPRSFEIVSDTTNNQEANTIQNISVSKNNLSYNDVGDGSMRLMRSPTPYPKELRLLAKYIRNDRRPYGSELLRVQEARVLFSSDNCNSYSLIENMGTDVLNIDDSSVLADNSNVTRNHHQMDHNTNGLTQFESVSESDPQESSYLTSLPNQRSQCHLTSNLDDVSNNLAVTLLKPPPYDIARIFTRKTAKDLINYEIIRYHQQFIHENSNHNEGKEIGQHPEEQILSKHNLNSHDNLVNQYRNLYNRRGNLHQFKDLEESAEQQNETDRKLHSLSYPSTSTAPNDSILTTESIITMDNKNIKYTLQKPLLKKKPWLFGVHKNPTVIQVSLKWDDHVGFDIEELPHKLNQPALFKEMCCLLEIKKTRTTR
ncbi:protein lap1 isoform X2 [Anastrepha ludens]|uniref:protein lap1 isoform X2 n=1 Tax=Anastrepha ludens TaxID=28586 RepID=UPI0023AEAA0D|nr:protein lap1 isoform X2 [Anastrepha ludens]